MQCNDVPDVPILEFVWTVNNSNRWANWYFGDDADVHPAFPQDVPDKLVHAKMNRLIARGLLDGCTCGCRGDYVVTAKGCEFIGRARHVRFCGDETL